MTAKSGNFSQTFNLTVIPQGPTLASTSFYNGADFQQGSISPCSIATIKANGLAPTVQGAVGYDGVGGLPYLLAGDSLTVGGAQAPIYNVANVGGQQQLTFQVPCSVSPGTNSVTVAVNGSSGSVDTRRCSCKPSPGLFTTQVTSTTSVPVLERPDGSFVGHGNPGRQGETLIAYVTGLGPTSPAVATNSLLPLPELERYPARYGDCGNRLQRQCQRREPHLREPHARHRWRLSGCLSGAVQACREWNDEPAGFLRQRSPARQRHRILQHAGYIPRSIIPSLSVLSWGRPCSAPFLFFAFDSPPINRL